MAEQDREQQQRCKTAEDRIPELGRAIDREAELRESLEEQIIEVWGV